MSYFSHCYVILELTLIGVIFLKKIINGRDISYNNNQVTFLI